MSDHTCLCPCPDPENLVPMSIHCSTLNIDKELFKDYPTRNEVEEKIQDAKDELDGKIDDTRNNLEEKIREAAEEADAKFVPQTRSVNTMAPLTGGGKLDHDLTLGFDPEVLDGLATKESLEEQIREIREALAKVTPYELCEFYFFRHPTLRPGFQLAQGGLLANAAALYPEAWAYLQTPEGKKLCKTEAEWQAMATATWATLADGTKVGWNGIGGAPFYALNTATGALRLPDLRGMYAEAAGFDGLGVGGVHGDGSRKISGVVYGMKVDTAGTAADGFSILNRGNSTGLAPGSIDFNTNTVFDSSRVAPTANKFQGRAWGALACVYLGLPAA